MHERVLVAPEYKKFKGSSIFLGGPIQQAPKWQQEAIEIIHHIDPKMWITNPRRDVDRKEDFTDEKYREQAKWERCFLERAAYDGCILFYNPQKLASNPEREYGQTTRVEEGTWMTRNLYDGANIVIGSEGKVDDKFIVAGMRYLEFVLGEDCPKVPKICDSLEETCREAVRIARNPLAVTPKEAMIRALMKDPKAADMLVKAVRSHQAESRTLSFDEFDRVRWERLGLKQFLR